MAFLRRICYVYYYEGTRKSENVGFVRIQAQNGAAKLFINIKLPIHVQAERVNLYLAGEGTPNFRLAMGNLIPVGRECSFKTVISVENVSGEGRPLSDYDGILVFDENGNIPLFGASFTERELPESFFAPDAFKVQQEPQNNTENMEKDENDADAAKLLETAEDSDDSGNTGMSDTDVEEAAAEEAVIEENAVTEISAGNAVQQKTAPSVQWVNMTRNIGKLCILEQGDCVAIRPFQLSRLPRKYWELSGNSYVLHGYYVYGHLILVRTVDEKGNEQIWLGVPGESGEKEEKEAKIFGFPYYKKRTVRRQSGMPEGYWCMLLK